MQRERNEPKKEKLRYRIEKIMVLNVNFTGQRIRAGTESRQSRASSHVRQNHTFAERPNPRQAWIKLTFKTKLFYIVAR